MPASLLHPHSLTWKVFQGTMSSTSRFVSQSVFVGPRCLHVSDSRGPDRPAVRYIVNIAQVDECSGRKGVKYLVWLVYKQVNQSPSFQRKLRKGQVFQKCAGF